MIRHEVVVYLCVALVASGAARTPSKHHEQKYSGQANSVIVDQDLNSRFNPPSEEDKAIVFQPTVPVNERFPSAVLFGRTCGGTILSEKWVLSAGHCTLFTGGREVLAGTNNSGDGSGVRRRVKQLYLHPLFTVGPYWLDATRFNITQVAARYDFLLAELEDPLPLNDKTIKAVTLDTRVTIPGGESVGYAGFGAEHHGETMRSDMHGMELKTLSESDCVSLRQFNKEDMVCARGIPPRMDSACNGDSGSGLVDENNMLVGVASWVENDALRCFNGAKVVFGKVSAAMEWIHEITGL